MKPKFAPIEFELASVLVAVVSDEVPFLLHIATYGAKPIWKFC